MEDYSAIDFLYKYDTIASLRVFFHGITKRKESSMGKWLFAVSLSIYVGIIYGNEKGIICIAICLFFMQLTEEIITAIRQRK